MRVAPAIAGLVAMSAAGFGTVTVGDSQDDTVMSSGPRQTTDRSYAGVDAGSTDGTDISRSFNRQVYEEQRTTQEEQLAIVAAQRQQIEQDVESYAEQVADQWVIPVTGYRLTARFGQSSGLWSSGQHTGLDLAGPSGTTIVAAASGTVKTAGYDGAYGNKTSIVLDDIDPGNQTEMWYAHQSRIVVEPGQKVNAGDVIGYTGATGNVTGPHLHLEVRPEGGEPVNPEEALQEHGVRP
ncbi:M23 family metallopeptidase [Aeromicrobium piscarium]|uniref:M23 family metallopeptidase n=1 Tax=Aeromicrobium piscarium TaxID=2590901 RepID=UPI001C8F5E8F|nr:M23 family metallopeptidase [Aeromicrobium piscarium]